MLTNHNIIISYELLSTNIVMESEHT